MPQISSQQILICYLFYQPPKEKIQVNVYEIKTKQKFFSHLIRDVVAERVLGECLPSIYRYIASFQPNYMLVSIELV